MLCIGVLFLSCRSEPKTPTSVSKVINIDGTSTSSEEIKAIIERCKAVRNDVKEGSPIKWKEIFPREKKTKNENYSIAFKRELVDWKVDVKTENNDASISVFRNGSPIIENTKDGLSFDIGFLDMKDDTLVLLAQVGESDWSETILYSVEKRKTVTVKGMPRKLKSGLVFVSRPDSSIQSFKWERLFNPIKKDWRCRSSDQITIFEPIEIKSENGKSEIIGVDDSIQAYACREKGDCLIEFRGSTKWIDTGGVTNLFGP